jgi:glycine/D-amino acid oxidase-like deaminating enzyme
MRQEVHHVPAPAPLREPGAARRFPDLAVPNRPKGIAGVYDVAQDWTPVYDKTALPGFYVAIGTSGNQFKNAPVVGALMDRIIDAAELATDSSSASCRRWSKLVAAGSACSIVVIQ